MSKYSLSTEAALTVFRQEVIRASDDELVTQSTKFFQLRIAFFLLLLGRIGVPATEDLELEILFEVQFRAKIFGIGEVEKGEIFRKVVLNRCSCQDDSALDI